MNIPQELIKMKNAHMEQVAAYRHGLYEKPVLKQLFFEFTQNCNEKCFHCGSSCGLSRVEGELEKEEWLAIIDEVAENFKPKPMLCITGGEPLLYKDFFEVMTYAKNKGFLWGMTTNATLVDTAVARKLKEAGMRTVSVSIDGLPETHDRQRGLKGGYIRAMKGIQAMIDVGFDHVQVTTVINHENIDQLDALFDIMDKIDIDSWRVINLEPMGRALDYPEKMMTPDDYHRLFSFIKEKREQNYPVCYGCTHYLGMDYERELRDWYFICSAGRTTASIMSKGEVGACLDIERNERSVQGNVRQERFTDIWNNKFSLFRQELDNIAENCKGCEHSNYCAGGSWHSYDFENARQRMCFKGVIF